MNQQHPQRTLLRTPTAMRAAFQTALEDVVYRSDTGPLSSYANLPVCVMVSTAMSSSAGLRKAPAWRATRKGPPQR